jgi:hypothetical protein
MLERAGHAPHILKMTPTQNHRTDADDHAAAIARWDDEGGAAKSSPGKTGVDLSRDRPSGRMTESRYPAKPTRRRGEIEDNGVSAKSHDVAPRAALRRKVKPAA